MEERKIKRLLIILATSIAIIMLFKMILTDTAVSLSKAAEEKKLAKSAKPQSPPQEGPAMEGIETSAGSADYEDEIPPDANASQD